MFNESDFAKHMLQAGARGYVMKQILRRGAGRSPVCVDGGVFVSPSPTRA